MLFNVYLRSKRLVYKIYYFKRSSFSGHRDGCWFFGGHSLKGKTGGGCHGCKSMRCEMPLRHKRIFFPCRLRNGCVNIVLTYIGRAMWHALVKNVTAERKDAHDSKSCSFRGW